MGDRSTPDDPLKRALEPRERARVDWLLEALRPGAPRLEIAEAADAFHRNLSGRLASIASLLSRRSARLGAHRVVGVSRAGARVIEVRLEDEAGRLWALRTRLRPEPPHRIDMLSLARPLPPGAVLREADESDGPSIEQIEAGAGIERADGTRVATVLGARLIELTRMTEEGRAWIVHVNGEPAACDAIAVRRVRHAGREARILYRHHTRVLPRFRRLGLNEALAARVSEISQAELQVESISVHVDPENSVIKEWSGIPPWKSRPFRALLPCATLAGPPAGRPATSADASAAAKWINALHEPEALFLPHDTTTLAERLGRQPRAYGWSQLLLGDDAVLGIWNPAERMTLESAARRIERCRAFVLDYGFQPAAGAAGLERLIRSCCGQLSRQGITHLSIFCCRGSPAERLIRSLADQVVDVEFQCGLPEPTEAGEFGVYVDHLYF